jgi:hypothetical protein
LFQNGTKRVSRNEKMGASFGGSVRRENKKLKL